MVNDTVTCLPSRPVVVSLAHPFKSATRVVLLLIPLRIAVVSIAEDLSRVSPEVLAAFEVTEEIQLKLWSCYL